VLPWQFSPLSSATVLRRLDPGFNRLETRVCVGLLVLVRFASFAFPLPEFLSYPHERYDHYQGSQLTESAISQQFRF
jgi:hypothetical protein